MGVNTRFRPLPCSDVKKALKNLGFTKKNKGSGTSHEQWRKVVDNKLYKATVDCHKGEVKAMDVRSIIKQAGVSKKQFFDAM